MAEERALDRLLKKEQIRLFNHDVNDTNLNIYLCQNEVDNINLDTLRDFFQDGLFESNIRGEHLTNILARNAFKGACTLEKTTKLFSFIYEVINPNYPGKTCGLCSLMEFVLLSYEGLVRVTNNSFAFKYFLWLINKNLEAGFDINYRDSCYNHFLVYCTLTAFRVNRGDNLSKNVKATIEKMIECYDSISITENDIAQITTMIKYCCDEEVFEKLLEIKNKIFSENTDCVYKTINFPCNEKYKYNDDIDFANLDSVSRLLYRLYSENEKKTYQKYKKYGI